MKKLFDGPEDIARYILDLIENTNKTSEWQAIGRHAYIKWYSGHQTLLLARMKQKKYKESVWTYEAQLIGQKLAEKIDTIANVSVTRIVSASKLRLPGPMGYWTVKVCIGMDARHNLTPEETVKIYGQEELH